MSPLWGEKSGSDLLDTVRVISEGEQELLQTRILQYQKGECALDVVGVVHIGEEEYYRILDERLSGYDAVLYEMIGKGKPLKPKKKRSGMSSSDPKNEMEAVTRMYSLYTTMLELELQKNCINYHQDHFIHADMTLSEFMGLQKKQDESVFKYAAKSMDLKVLEDIDQSVMMGAMLSGDSTVLKQSFIKILGKADEPVSKKKDTSVIIRARNEKCLTVLKEVLDKEEAPEKVAIFYGAGHLPDFNSQLTEQGWVLTGSEWVNAWKVGG